MRPKAPCKDCGDRCQGCHDRCEKYRAFKEESLKFNIAMDKARRNESYFVNNKKKKK